MKVNNMIKISIPRKLNAVKVQTLLKLSAWEYGEECFGYQKGEKLFSTDSLTEIKNKLKNYMDNYKKKRSKKNFRILSIPNDYVEYVTQDCPIMGKTIVRHQLLNTKNRKTNAKDRKFFSGIQG